VEEFETLEEVQEALEVENGEWNKAGLNLANLQMGALAPLMLDMQAKIQAMINILIVQGTITEADINFEYKKIILNDMRALRAAAPEQEKEAIRQQILRNVQMPNGKPPWMA